MEIKQWLSENSNRRITDQDIATMLNVTRKTANKRINEGLTAEDLITLCGKLGINRVLALVELDYIPHSDVLDYLDSDGALIATAEDGDLALELARRLNPATRAEEIDELAARRAGAPVSDVDDSMPLSAVAYSGPDEDAERDDAYDD